MRTEIGKFTPHRRQNLSVAHQTIDLLEIESVEITEDEDAKADDEEGEGKSLTAVLAALRVPFCLHRAPCRTESSDGEDGPPPLVEAPAAPGTLTEQRVNELRVRTNSLRFLPTHCLILPGVFHWFAEAK